MGKWGKIQVLVLVDSGSVGSFISTELAKQLSHALSPYEPTQFVAADGSPMICNQRFKNLHWMCQWHTFVSDVGVLPLKFFDTIVGQDWLEASSPMWVHWSKKGDEIHSPGQQNQTAGPVK